MDELRALVPWDRCLEAGIALLLVLPFVGMVVRFVAELRERRSSREKRQNVRFIPSSSARRTTDDSRPRASGATVNLPRP
jgi:hypothetical protein